MAKMVVLGGGVIGLATGLMLTRDGHDVTVFERDREPVPGSPEDAWRAWERRGVAQFRQPHYLHAAARKVLDDELPDVKQALLDAGGFTFNPCALLPPSIADRAPQPDDDRFETVTARRPVIEYAVASVADGRLRVERGATIAELLTGPAAASGIPRVTGVRTADGVAVAADLVIDAMGRRSAAPNWLAAIGARPPREEAEESSFIYYTRYFRSMTGGMPPFRSAVLTHYHSFSLLTLPCDSGTWSVTVFIFAGDPALKALRELTLWTALVQTCPLHAHWLDGEPITDVLAMAGITNRRRRFVVDGVPVVTGIVSVGDAWACTNPIRGRGISIGLMHAAGTVEVIRQHLGDPMALALAQDAMTESRMTPWYDHTVLGDRQRSAQIQAVIHGSSAPLPVDPEALDPERALMVALQYDADLFRAFLEINSVLVLPREALARPGVLDRVREMASGREPFAPPCPPREELLRMLA